MKNSTPEPADVARDVAAAELRSRIYDALDALPRREGEPPVMPAEVRTALLDRADGKISVEDLQSNPAVRAWRDAQSAYFTPLDDATPQWVAVGDLIAELAELDPSEDTWHVFRRWAVLQPVSAKAPLVATGAILRLAQVLCRDGLEPFERRVLGLGWR